MRVLITDVVLRDGLQDQPVVLPVPDRCAVAESLVAAGVRSLEVASFVSPARVPQMAGAEELLAALPQRPGVRYAAIALNARGVRRAHACRPHELRVVVSAGAGHSRANAGRDTAAALEDLAAVLPEVDRGVSVTAAVATAFRCPYDGPVPPARVVAILRRFHELGVRDVSLADTLGTATVEQVRRTVESVRSALPDVDVGLHLHDARGQALATVDAALALGVRRFDSALGGLGGCPFAPGAHGNLATETVVAHLHAQGIMTGISEPALSDARALLATALRRAKPIPATP